MDVINSKNDYLKYLEQDKLALGKKYKFPKLVHDEIWRFEILLRKTEYYVKSEIGIHNFPKAILICFIKCVGEGGLKLISTIKILKSLPPDASAHFSLIPNQILILIVIQLQILQQPTNSSQKEK